MNVLIVDDQISVIDGIMSGVHFKELGIDVVRSATSSEEALAVFNEIPVDIILTDIEMPGENGLELNKKIQEKYPDTLRILLTSHAEFRYAQESVKLGCFDYLLQPTPYEDIEDCLLRALQYIYQKRKNTRLYQYGQLLETNETELMDHMVTELFSRVPEDANSSLEFLNKMGYPISKEKKIQIIIINVQSFRISEEPIFSEKSIHKAISNALKPAGITYPILALSTVNRFRQFVLVLFSATSEDVTISAGQYQLFYEKLSAELADEALTCYISNWIAYENARDEIKQIHLFIDENISNSTGIYLTSGQDISASVTTNLAESVERWETLITAGQKRMLDNEIEDFLKSTVANSKNKLKSLCELHQQLTHIFWGFFYDNNADLSELFNEKYTYSDYMNSFKDIDSLRKSVSFMLNAIDDIQKNTVAKSDVEKAKTFIANNISNPITVKDVADHVNLSAEYFTKLFKRASGQNIKDYIARSKVSAAKEMLEHSNISVSMIALELGYSYFSHFTQVFKKYEHVTPSEYRSRFLNQ
jgi:YesN/AraC family two-component response regulator